MLEEDPTLEFGDIEVTNLQIEQMARDFGGFWLSLLLFKIKKEYKYIYFT